MIVQQNKSYTVLCNKNIWSFVLDF
jgi:hypothetical protein